MKRIQSIVTMVLISIPFHNALMAADVDSLTNADLWRLLDNGYASYGLSSLLTTSDAPKLIDRINQVETAKTPVYYWALSYVANAEQSTMVLSNLDKKIFPETNGQSRNRYSIDTSETASMGCLIGGLYSRNVSCDVVNSIFKKMLNPPSDFELANGWRPDSIIEKFPHLSTST